MKVLFFTLIYILSISAFAQATDTTEIRVTELGSRPTPLDSEDIHGGETWYALGNFAWMDFVNTNLKYPKRALKKRAQGTVQVKFRLTRNGKIRFIRVVGKRLGKGMTKEAKRIVKLSQHGGWWIKEDEKGRAKPSKGRAVVDFKLNFRSQ